MTKNITWTTLQMFCPSAPTHFRYTNASVIAVSTGTPHTLCLLQREMLNIKRQESF